MVSDEKIDLCPNADVSFLMSVNWKTPPEWDGIFREHQISAKLFELANAEEKAGRKKEEDTFRCLAHAIDMGTDLDDYQNPFRPKVIMDSFRSPQATDFNGIHTDIFVYVVSNTDNLAVKARLADVLWVLRKNPDFCRTAIDAYLAKAKKIVATLDRKERFESVHDMKRAIQLWRMLGSKADLKDEIVSVIESCIEINAEEPEDFVRFFFVELASDAGILDDKKGWIQKCEELAAVSIKQKRYDKARSYLECGITLSKQAKERELTKQLVIKQTDLYEQEAREMQAAVAAPMLLQHLFVSAIEANQNANKVVGGRKAKIDELHQELNSVSLRIKDDLKPISAPIDLSKPMKILLESLAKNSTRDGLAILAEKTRPRPWKEFEQSAKDVIKNFPLSSLFAGVSLDDKGRIVSRSPGMSLNDKDEQKVALVQKAYQLFQSHVLVIGTLINNGRLELRSRMDCDETIFDKFLECNPFVPKDRIPIFRRGFWLGFNGDWMSSMHILIPQIENSLRHLLETMGILVTKIDEELIQQERDLNTLLYTSPTTEALGEDLFRVLRGLLTEKAAFNLRNRLSHGLLSSDHFYEGYHLPPFVWAFTLFMCLEFRSAFFSRLAASNLEPESKEEDKNA